MRPIVEYVEMIKRIFGGGEKPVAKGKKAKIVKQMKNKAQKKGKR